MLVVAPEVQDALMRGKAVVALETTLIAHGIPKPDNLELAQEIEQVVRQHGAIPATIGVLDGQAKVGLNADDIARLATANDVAKCSTRDLAYAIATSQNGATTIASTLYLARLAGIRFMATGGLGGVHPGGEDSMDVSADLNELGRSAMAIVCSGPKIILDLARTMEVLETQGISVVGFGCRKLPGFYIEATEIAVPEIATSGELAQLMAAHERLSWPGSIVIANPPPKEFAFEEESFRAILATANARARMKNIRGKALTPFLLAQIAALTEGRSVTLNKALVLANAQLAAKTAAALAEGQA